MVLSRREFLKLDTGNTADCPLEAPEGVVLSRRRFLFGERERVDFSCFQVFMICKRKFLCLT